MFFKKRPKYVTQYLVITTKYELLYYVAHVKYNQRLHIQACVPQTYKI